MKRWLTVTVVVAITFAALSAVALAASSPAVTTRSASNVKQQSAVLNGTINPNGAPTSYYFQWGLDQNYGVNGATRSAGSGTKAVNVRQTAAGLIPGTTYHYRLVAVNKFGTTTGADRTFKTAGHPPPGVATGPASQVGKNSATITGVINPNGANTTWYFQWGTSTTYTNNTTGGFVSGSSAPVIVAQALSGLQAGTIFHYRLVAANGPSGPSGGADAIFMTHPLRRPTPRVTRRVAPLHARRHHQPWTYTISGSVGHPASTPPQFACTGFVGVRFFTGGKRVNFALAPLHSNCTYSTQVVFHRKPGRGPRGRVVTMHVLVHYRGNGYLAPSDARKQTVTLG
jgi:phosphodiesterase/alkaline phosphatase D-like protein